MADADVEQLMLRLLGSTPINDFLDLGTGTGRVLEVVSGHSERALGIDSSREMLSVARANLTAKELHNCQVRHGNIYALDLPDGCMDAVSIHHVLHFLDEPAAAIAQAARTLRPGGRLLVVDLAPHRLEFLRTEFAHRRLGFADEEVAAWCTEAGLKDVTAHHIEKAAPGTGQDERFCIAVWSAVQHAEASAHYTLDVA